MEMIAQNFGKHMICLWLLCFSCLGSVFGQNEASQQLFVQVLGVSELEFTPSGSDVYVFDNAVKLESGIERMAGEIAVKSNKDWRVSASIDLRGFYYFSDNVVPNDFFQVAVMKSLGNPIFQTIGSSASNIIQGGPGGVSSNSYKVYYRILPGYKIAPSNYKMTILFTLSQN
ncbi:hypothetical protein KZP23_02915 [Echinicola marina]|uniref:hypothetical protein n=1 Tax=Echinicola marina TaxID=2859768 RepID=UPI001CF6252C|nr:hypothetical protein [Echinicola marina]UCS93999.1 hypothetical protein KZP23_02915 [Echinicola marina]